MTVVLIATAALSTGVRSTSAAELDLVPAHSRTMREGKNTVLFPPHKLNPVFQEAQHRAFLQYLKNDIWVSFFMEHDRLISVKEQGS